MMFSFSGVTLTAVKLTQRSKCTGVSSNPNNQVLRPGVKLQMSLQTLYTVLKFIFVDVK